MNELVTSALPAICAELKIRNEGESALVNSRDLAVVFEKEHKHVLRDINSLEISPDLGRSWFRPATVLDAYGREQPSFDLTRQGVALLVMGWTGEKAMVLKVRYIQAFDAMEEALKAQYTGMVHVDKLYAGMMEATTHAMQMIERTHIGHVALRGDVETIRTDIVDIKNDVRFLKAHAPKPPRRNLTELTKGIHISAIAQMGGYCPCCRHSQVVAPDGRKMPFAEFDHFYQSSKPSADETWLICTPCHRDLTTGKVSRQQREAEFRAYQQTRSRLPGEQQRLQL